MTKSTAAAEIHDTNLADALSERYLSYALSTIMARSLPDVRDGLKPVHRRLLYAMMQLKLDPANGFKKCARIVGDVMGKYHPHGNDAIYDAMVRLAQSFAVRYPLVDGQGNFGNIDGDNAAAMRYTEARLTAVAQALLAGIDEDAVDLRATYDEEGEEPVVLPAAFPNLLANGAAGIAVGMATSIPPHNAGELCKALLHLIKFPRATTEKLVDLVGGPDLPTGGIIVEPHENIVAAYRTGRGSFRVRARWQVESHKGGGYAIIVTEIPYQVQKSRLVEKIAELMQARKLPMLADIRDESAADLRLVLEPRSRNVKAETLMEHLFRLTDLETRVSLNMNVLDARNVPRVMSLREVLQAFLDHRHAVLQRLAHFRLARAERRIEVLGGLRIAYLNLDEIIRLIREEDEPKPAMRARWELSDLQAEAILNMRLRALRKLEEIAIRKELAQLEGVRADLAGLLGDETRRWAAIATEIRDIGKRFGGNDALGRRRTSFAQPPAADVIPIEAMIEREPVTVICSAKGWIRAMRGHLDAAAAAELKYKEGDKGRFVTHAQTTDKLLIVASNGRFHTLGVERLPRGRGHAEPVRLMVDLGNDDELVALRVHRPGGRLLVAAGDGHGFVVAEDDVVAHTRHGRQVMKLRDGARMVACVPADGDSVAVLGENRKLLLFALAEVSEMSRGRGVMLQRYRNDGLADVLVFTRAEGLAWSAGRRTRHFDEDDLAPWFGKRALAGRLPPPGAPRAKRFR